MPETGEVGSQRKNILRRKTERRKVQILPFVCIRLANSTYYEDDDTPSRAIERERIADLVYQDTLRKEFVKQKLILESVSTNLRRNR